MESEKNEIISGLNEQINGLKKRNMESELLLRVYHDKFKSLDARVVKMDREIKILKAAEVNDKLFESLGPRVVKVENIAHIVVDEEGANVKFPDYEGEKVILGNDRTQEGRNSDAGAPRKGSADSREEGKTVGDDDDDKKKKKKRDLVGPSKTRSSCRVPACNADITDKTKYYHRSKTCGFHAKADVVLLAGVEQRFCQLCKRFHELAEFDEAKISCRTSYNKNNRDKRRRADVGDDDNKKRKRALIGPFKTWSCKVPGCNVDTTDEKLYSHHRNKICGFHAKADAVLIAGVEQRFCQSCTRFHELSEFDEAKRGCRTSYAKRNRDGRRRTIERRRIEKEHM